MSKRRADWLNPPEWTRTEILEFPGTLGGPWSRYIDPPKVAPSGPDGAEPRSTSPARSASARQKKSSQPQASEGLAGLPSIGTVRYPRLVPKDAACAKELKKRTLTNLYNQRPKWLQLAHEKLDAAVFAAYGWSTTLTDDELLARLLELNLSRAAAQT